MQGPWEQGPGGRGPAALGRRVQETSSSWALRWGRPSLTRRPLLAGETWETQSSKHSFIRVHCLPGGALCARCAVRPPGRGATPSALASPQATPWRLWPCRSSLSSPSSPTSPGCCPCREGGREGGTRRRGRGEGEREVSALSSQHSLGPRALGEPAGEGLPGLGATRGPGRGLGACWAWGSRGGVQQRAPLRWSGRGGLRVWVRARWVLGGGRLVPSGAGLGQGALVCLGAGCGCGASGSQATAPVLLAPLGQPGSSCPGASGSRCCQCAGGGPRECFPGASPGPRSPGLCLTSTH